MKSELDGTQNVKEEFEDMLECSKEEVYTWKEEAREQKAEAARLNCCVRRSSSAFHAVGRVH